MAGMPHFVRLREERRNHRRSRVDALAGLRSAAGTIEVWLHDVSVGGAQLEADEPPAVGSAATLEYRGFRADGTVAWTVGPRFGIRFSRLVDPSALIAPPRGLDAAMVRRPA